MELIQSKINGYSNEEWNHLSAASYISRGMADVAFGIQSAASHLGLDFIPVAKEQFDLVFRFTNENKQILTDLIHYLQSASFKDSLTDLEGYDISDLGKIIYQTSQTEETTMLKNRLFCYTYSYSCFLFYQLAETLTPKIKQSKREKARTESRTN